VLDTFDAELSLQIDDLIWHQRRWRNLAAEASLKQGVLDLRRAEVDAANGTLRARGTLRPAPADRTITAEITAANAMIALRGMTEEELDQLPRHAAVAQLSASGNAACGLRPCARRGAAWKHQPSKRRADVKRPQTGRTGELQSRSATTCVTSTDPHDSAPAAHGSFAASKSPAWRSTAIICAPFKTFSL
jgi:hypothetical protein